MRSVLHLAIALLAFGFALPGTAEEWFLSEFDWGDNRALVDESVRVAPAFQCGFVARRCAVVSADIDGEELQVQFGYYQHGLYRIRVGTPPLPANSRHLERIWKHLVKFLTQEKGPAAESGAFPDLAMIRADTPVVTHLWRFPDQEIRIEVSREKRERRVGAVFLDPVRSAQRKAAKESAAEPAPAGTTPSAQK